MQELYNTFLFLYAMSPLLAFVIAAHVIAGGVYFIILITSFLKHLKTRIK
jgi:hypothetical protein